ncbi:phospholipid scramblase, putative [Plasmodium gallinaceum]|uniref:Phospholipid scramblase n=1 Tax=Plasmodium gallinaceum TaxID=5849 RepID=A0A1J1GXF3_PLAGA|nr:phospholipid scramblase, putative [Plasmodium gallinaceum]CRG97241.1 phospholipid scramblase, putative [Plasmodium gallinaceum]
MDHSMNMPVNQTIYGNNMINKVADNQFNQPNTNNNYQNPNMNNLNHVNPMPPPQQQMHMFSNDWKSVIASIKSCKIQQVFNNKEFVADFFIGINLDFSNKYLILDASNNVTKFVAIENSHFANRNCLPKICIPVEMKILRQGKELNMPDLLVEKDCSCTICCLNRPTIKMYDFSNNNNKELIGIIKSPFSCCSYKFDLFDTSNNKIIYMDDTCCQLSILCPLPCGACKYSNFYLHDAKTKEKVAHLIKEVPFLQLVKKDIDNYVMNFEQVVNPEWKMMVLAFALFLDYIYYDYKK